MSADSLLWDMIWTNWRTIPPPPGTIVLARYDDLKDEKPIRVRTCRRGCCIDAGFGSMKLPRWWTAIEDQTSPLEYESPASTSNLTPLEK
jgi:hypothetical protein